MDHICSDFPEHDIGKLEIRDTDSVQEIEESLRELVRLDKQMKKKIKRVKILATLLGIFTFILNVYCIVDMSDNPVKILNVLSGIVVIITMIHIWWPHFFEGWLS